MVDRTVITFDPHVKTAIICVFLALVAIAFVFLLDFKPKKPPRDPDGDFPMYPPL